MIEYSLADKSRLQNTFLFVQ